MLPLSAPEYTAGFTLGLTLGPAEKYSQVTTLGKVRGCGHGSGIMLRVENISMIISEQRRSSITSRQGGTRS